MSQINRNQLIHKINDYLPNDKIQFKKHEITGDLQIIFTNKKAIMTVLESNTWDEIKRHIDAKMSNEKNDECSICSTEEIQKRFIKKSHVDGAKLAGSPSKAFPPRWGLSENFKTVIP